MPSYIFEAAQARLSQPITVAPVAPAGTVDTKTLQQIIDPNAYQTATPGQQLAPTATIYPVLPTGVNVPNPSEGQPSDSSTISIDGLMTWAQANPLAAAAIVAGGIYLLYKATGKKKRK